MTSPTSQSLPVSRRVELGFVTGAHALRGELRVRFLGDGPEHLMAAERVWLAENREDPALVAYPIEGVRLGRAREVRMTLEGVNSRDDAEALRGKLVLVDSDTLSRLDEDEYYWHELIGSLVVTEQGDEVGRVEEIWETGGHDVLVVRRPTGPPPALIPTARAIMKEIDLAEGRIVIDAIAGLLTSGEEEGA